MSKIDFFCCLWRPAIFSLNKRVASLANWLAYSISSFQVFFLAISSSLPRCRVFSACESSLTFLAVDVPKKFTARLPVGVVTPSFCRSENAAGFFVLSPNCEKSLPLMVFIVGRLRIMMSSESRAKQKSDCGVIWGCTDIGCCDSPKPGLERILGLLGT